MQNWMIYGGPGFLAVVWFGSSPTPPPPPSVSSTRKTGRLRRTGRLRKSENLLKGEGGGGGRGSESCDHEKAWSSINHAVLSAPQLPTLPVRPTASTLPLPPPNTDLKNREKFSSCTDGIGCKVMYDKMRESFPVHEEAVSHIRLCILHPFKFSNFFNSAANTGRTNSGSLEDPIIVLPLLRHYREQPILNKYGQNSLFNVHNDNIVTGKDRTKRCSKHTSFNGRKGRELCAE